MGFSQECAVRITGVCGEAHAPSRLQRSALRVVFIRLRDAHNFDSAFNADLPFELVPEEDERATADSLRFSPFAAVVVREEREATVVERACSSTARVEGTPAGAGGENHRVGFGDFRRDGLIELMRARANGSSPASVFVSPRGGIIPAEVRQR